MSKKIYVSTPSRICLFGEHLDYLGLEVIASAINLRFYAEGVDRQDNLLSIHLTGENIEAHEEIDLSKKIEYKKSRDYLKSAVNILLRHGYKFNHGYNIKMDSEIPIGKGMSSSTTMIVVFIKILLELINHKDKDDVKKIAELGFEAEVTEFNEPGGMMDHYTSALGNLVDLTFESDGTKIIPINKKVKGCFILFDSLQDKNTTKVLTDAKEPVLEALNILKKYGINSIKDFIIDESNMEYLKHLNDRLTKKISASIDNYRILLTAKKMLLGNEFDNVLFGQLITKHHINLRDGLGISTERIENILSTAIKNGALGGKINGSGGGGCCYVYAMEKDADKIVKAVNELGYPGVVIKQDSGVRKDKEEEI